ncbi:hypothetical protein OROHE_012687 [Orobanche hederae]
MSFPSVPPPLIAGCAPPPAVSPPLTSPRALPSSFPKITWVFGFTIIRALCSGSPATASCANHHCGTDVNDVEIYGTGMDIFVLVWIWGMKFGTYF